MERPVNSNAGGPAPLAAEKQVCGCCESRTGVVCAFDEIERLDLARLQAVHERDCAVEDVKRLTLEIERLHGVLANANELIRMTGTPVDVTTPHEHVPHPDVNTDRCGTCGQPLLDAIHAVTRP